MNFDELLSIRDQETGTFSCLLLGKLVKRNVDGKYQNVIDVRDDLSDNIIFCESLKYELKALSVLKPQRQLHFMLGKDDTAINSVKTIIIERGVYLTLAQLLNDNPSLVARQDFTNNLLKCIFEATKELNGQNIFHECFDPRNVLVRKGDSQVFLLNHGSFYKSITDQQAFFGDMKEFVAPEVLEKGTVDERCDVYSIGKLIESLYSLGSMPLVVKKVVKKAISELPEDRYNSVDDMEKALSRLNSAMHSTVLFVVAAFAALFIVGTYFTIVPEQNEMEYVKPAPQEPEMDLDDGFNPATELGFIANDTASQLTPEQQKKMAEYEKKAEEIFRKRFELEADRILSKLYNVNNMGFNEKKFMAISQKTLEELSKAQEKIASQTAISGAKSQRIASEIVERIANKKKKELK